MSNEAVFGVLQTWNNGRKVNRIRYNPEFDYFPLTHRDTLNMSVSSSSSQPSSPALSGSSTPLSDVSSFLQTPLMPETFVLLNTSALTTDTLGSLFRKHGRTESLGLIVDTDSSMECAKEGRWSSDDTEGCHVSSLFTPTIDWAVPYISTTRENANHLHIISSAGLRPVLAAHLTPSQTLYILEQPAFTFPPLSAQRPFSPQAEDNAVCRGNIPTLDEWRNLWKAWDLVTLRMIPEEMLHQKPIDLRHKCLFYIGHIPTFLDMLLSKSIGGSPSEPAHFWNIFERGIDPHVDDPSHCHNHSDVPEKDEDWPSLASVLAFRDRVRQRLCNLYADIGSGKRTLSRNLARTLVMTLEHEGFHVETLLYMLIQRAGTGTLPPPGFRAPEWSALVQQWQHIPAPTMSLPVLGPTKLTMGHDDSEADDAVPALNASKDVVNGTYGWDNESPARIVDVGAFKAEWRPITNGEYLAYWQESQGLPVPKSWAEECGELKVRTLYGPVAMDIAKDWPILASYDELHAYAKSKGGRLPTEPELRLFLDTYDMGHEGGANVGFRNWHPVPATTGLGEHHGKGSNGGVWEWTSTLFDTHDGLVPTNLFTGYSTDFFDTKHHVALGASYATIPRLTRKTVRNFYQHNYPYPWLGARVVYDVVA